VGHRAVLPEHAVKSFCAIARLADGLAFVVDGVGEPVRVASDSREFLNLALFPEHRPKVQNLARGYAGWIRLIILSYPGHLARLLMLTTWPLFPPNVGRGVITPFCQTKGRHTRSETGRLGEKKKPSPKGSGLSL